jgi:hypothetical protein
MATLFDEGAHGDGVLQDAVGAQGVVGAGEADGTAGFVDLDAQRADQADDPDELGAEGEELLDLAGELVLVLTGVGVLDRERRRLGGPPGPAQVLADDDVGGAEVLAVVEGDADVDADVAAARVHIEGDRACGMIDAVAPAGGHATDRVAVGQLVGVAVMDLIGPERSWRVAPFGSAGHGRIITSRPCVCHRA